MMRVTFGIPLIFLSNACPASPVFSLLAVNPLTEQLEAAGQRDSQARGLGCS